MAKNILKNDVVHHVRNMMPAQRKRTLPKVVMSFISGASTLWADGPASPCKAFLPEKQGINIKLRKTYLKGL